jgi:hypothetical protein
MKHCALQYSVVAAQWSDVRTGYLSASIGRLVQNSYSSNVAIAGEAGDRRSDPIAVSRRCVADGGADQDHRLIALEPVLWSYRTYVPRIVCESA